MIVTQSYKYIFEDWSQKFVLATTFVATAAVPFILFIIFLSLCHFCFILHRVFACFLSDEYYTALNLGQVIFFRLKYTYANIKSKWWQFDQINDVHGALKAPIKSINIFFIHARRHRIRFDALSLWRLKIKSHTEYLLPYQQCMHHWRQFHHLSSFLPSALSIQSN